MLRFSHTIRNPQSAIRNQLFLIAFLSGGIVIAQTDAPPADGPDLVREQARIAERYERLELLAGRLAELSRSSEPRRAQLLRNLIAAGREHHIPGRYDTVLAALERGELANASSGQAELIAELEQLLKMLLEEDRDRQIESEKKRISEYLAELNKILRLQRGILGSTEGGAECDKLAKDQRGAAGNAGELSERISDDDAKRSGEPSGSQPSEGNNQGQEGDQNSSGSQSGNPPGSSEQQPPTGRAADRLQQAQENMRRAAEALEQAQREGAADEQRKAIERLAEAKAELEKILRQLREEELQRSLAMLESRLRKMLDDQIAVLRRTQVLEEAQPHTPAHEMEISAGRLSRRQTAISRDADRVLTLLREDGTSVAFPEALTLAKQDMDEVAERLNRVKLSTITQGLEEDIIALLEEAVAAVRQAQEELEEGGGQSQPGSGGQGEQELVDQLSEIRMIRGLQMRINRRTAQYSEMIQGEVTDKADLREALDRLGQRQQRVFEATRDLEAGANR